MTKKSKLVLGTVQLGMPYGVNNSTGQPSVEEAMAILDAAWAAGINTFDTAYAYGTSEEVLGEWIKSRGVADQVFVISKLKPHILNDYPDGTKAVDIVRSEIKKSLARLQLSKLDGYLLHSPHYVYLNHVMTGLQQAKAEGLVTNIGVSIYNEPEALQAAELPVDYIQIPYNTFDRRIDKTDFFELVKKNKVTVFARVPFLQGLLVMEPEKLPSHLAHARPYLEKLIGLSKKWNISRAALALFFSYLHPADNHLVFGVEQLAQLKEDVELIANPPVAIVEAVAEINKEFENMSHSIVLSSLWGKLK
jgi:aryl-alcohol dehydrogenase-like predicted oxidoreductase